VRAMIFLFLALLAWPEAHSAEVTIVQYQSTASDIEPKESNNSFEPFILLQGEIVEGDFERVQVSARQLADMGFPLVIKLESPGGSVFEALEIADFVRASWGTTWLMGRTASLKDPDRSIVTCDSACAIIFFSGVERRYMDSNIRIYGADDPYFIPYKFRPEQQEEAGVSGALSDDSKISGGVKMLKAEVIPVLGLHRPYIAQDINSQLKGSESALFYGQMEEQVRQRLSVLGIPITLVDRMMRTSSANVDRIGGFMLLDFIPSKEPWFEEWIIANCGGLSSEEWWDYLRASGDHKRRVRGVQGPFRFTDQDYFNFKSRISHRTKCQRAAILEHQRASSIGTK
jgi:hypothetical protein